MQIVTLKQSPDQAASSIGLDKYNKSIFPGTFQVLQPYLDTNTQRWYTGLDEEDPDLRAMYGDDYLEAKERIKSERESLEKLTGLDLSGTSKYWENYRITFTGSIVLDLEKPADRIRYAVLVKNNFAAPNPDVVNSPEYVNTKFYLSRTAEEESNKAKLKKEKNKAIAGLTGIEDNKNRLLVVAQYLYGNAISDDQTMDSLYNLLSDFISDDKKGVNIRKFNEAIVKTTEELLIKINIDQAIRFNIIRQRDGVYQRGNITLGKDLPDVVKYLSNIENSHELSSIIEEVRERRVLGSNY